MCDGPCSDHRPTWLDDYYYDGTGLVLMPTAAEEAER